MGDPKTTGQQTKKVRENLKLLQHVLRGREAAKRVVESFDHIERMVIDALDELVEEVDPLPDPVPGSAPEKTSQMNPRMDRSAFEKIVMDRFEAAKSDADQENVRTIVQSGRITGVLSQDESDALLERLK